RYQNAIKALNDYLSEYMSDPDAYQELLNIYLDQNEYKKAAFCAEELILSNPHNYLYMLQYAEILYTMGDYKLARKYFCESLNLNKENNMRALYGLLLVKNFIYNSNN